MYPSLILGKILLTFTNPIIKVNPKILNAVKPVQVLMPFALAKIKMGTKTSSMKYVDSPSLTILKMGCIKESITTVRLNLNYLK